MLAAGKWVPHNPDKINPDRTGFHLSSLYSPYGWYSWADAAAEWEDAQNDQNELKVFINTVLGEVWEEEGEVPEWENLYNRRENYPVNTPWDDVCFITAGVDVQKDRLELEIVGWIPGKRTQSIDYRALEGDTAKKPVWDELAKVMNETWETESGRVMGVQMMAVDTGYNTTHAYDFCRRYTQNRVVPIKGNDRMGVALGQPSAVDRTSSGRRSKKIMLWNIGVGILKSELYGWLRSEQNEDDSYPDGYCHFPEYGRSYFKGLTAEKLVKKKDRRGFKKYEWVKEFERNEPLDCRVYARAAASIIGMDRFEEQHWEEIKGKSRAGNKKSGRKKRRSGESFW
jgi:phage terminase large subunit GpA-like protein